MKRKILYLAILLISGAVTLNSCGNKSSSAAKPITTGTNPVDQANASVVNFAFSPSNINLNVGGSVTWTNNDATAHTVTDVGGVFDSGNLAVNGTYTYKFTTAGTYTYYCKYHSMMAKATVTVK